MSDDSWVLLLLVGAAYFACLFTVGVITFRKGRLLLLVLGVFLPLLWFVGALLPAKHRTSASGT